MNGYDLCTGNHSATDYWNLTTLALQNAMNRLNTFSPANSAMTLNGAMYYMAQLLNDHTYISHRERGDDTWRA